MTWSIRVLLLVVSLLLYAIPFNCSYKDPQHGYLIDTSNCKIQNFTMKYRKTKFDYNVCGSRHIFVKTLPDNQIQFHFSNDFYHSCLYRFIDLKSTQNSINLDIRNPIWMPFSNGTMIYMQSEFIKVQCYPTEGYEIYDDVYAKIKRLNATSIANNNQTRTQDVKPHWNVLMIGMDSMSRVRAYDELPNTVGHFQKQGWMDFKGYNMISDSSFSNLMSVLTNKNLSTLSRICQPSMSFCNENFIWSRFKDAGYVTAVGEDCFNRSYMAHTENGMKLGVQPTDHYLHPVFIDGEIKIGPNYCTKTMLSAKHVFSYAFEFVNTYKNDKFFGFFQLSSLSHDSDQSPTSFDVPLMLFFEKLKNLGVLSNTFVIFFSDCGLENSYTNSDIAAAYYEKRLPMLFIKIPNMFKRVYHKKYVTIFSQQSRLITPFDLHLTLWGIALNFERLYPLPIHEGCPNCDSLFEVIAPNRTCADAGIADTWCACHDITPFLKRQDYGLEYSLNIIMLRLYNITKSIRTVYSTRCQEFKLSKLLNIQKYIEMPKMVYLITGTLWPDQTVFQANVSKRISHVTSTNISRSSFEYSIESLELKRFTTRLQCALNETERMWCICEKTEHSSIST